MATKATGSVSLEAGLAVSALEQATNTESCWESCCCGYKVTWRDPLMAAVETVSAAGIVYSLFQQSYYVTGGSAIVTLSSCVIHALWRRDGAKANLRETVDAIGKTDEKIDKTIDKTNEVANKIQVEDAKLETTGEILEGQSKTLENDLATLDKEEKASMARVKELEGVNKELLTRNKKLRGQVSNLQKALKTLKEDLQQFAQENVTFKKSVTGLSGEVKELDKEEKTLSGTLERVDSRIDEDVGQLGTFVQAARSSSQEVFALLSARNEQLKKQIDELGGAVSRLDAEDDDLEQKTKNLSDLEERTAKARSELEAIQKEFTTISTSLETARKQWTAEREQLEAERASLTKTNTDLSKLQGNFSTVANKFADIGTRVEAAVSGMQKLDAEISKQFDEIDKL